MNEEIFAERDKEAEEAAIEYVSKFRTGSESWRIAYKASALMRYIYQGKDPRKQV